jgi:hypothetical protein
MTRKKISELFLVQIWLLWIGSQVADTKVGRGGTLLPTKVKITFI